MSDFDTDPGDAPSETPKRRRSLRRGALGCLIVLATIGVGVWVAGTRLRVAGERERDLVLLRIEAREPGWGVEAIIRERAVRMPAPDVNAANVVLAVPKPVEGGWKWRKNTEWFPGEPSPHPYSPEQEAELRLEEAATRPARELAQTLRDRPTGQFAFAFPENPLALMLPHIDQASRVVALLEYEAALASLDGDANRALRAAHAALNASRAIADEPTLVSQNFRMRLRSLSAAIAERALSQGTPTVGLAELQAAFLADAEEPLFLYGVRGERAAMHTLFTGLQSGRLSATTALPLPDCPAILKPGLFEAYRPLLPADNAEYLRVMTGYVEAAKLPWPEQRAAVRAVLPNGPSTLLKHSITRLMVPACEKIADGGLRSRARLLVAATGLACERFRQQNGRWPRDLGELPKATLANVPVSPFDGTPLRYRVLADRIAIWCIEDDHAPFGPNPPEFQVAGDRATGHGVRLWNAEVRGKPQKP